MISKLKSKLTSIALGLTLSPIGTVNAQGGVTPVVPPSTINVPAIVNKAMNWSFGLLIVLAAAFILYAAFLYLTSATQPEKLETAKKYIIYAVVAIVVGFVARGLVSIVIDLLQ